MTKQYWSFAVALLLVLAAASTTLFFVYKAKSTESVLVDHGKEAFDLLTHWSQGNIVALIRHAERCDRSENECLDSEKGITVVGKDKSIRLGNDIRSLFDLSNAEIYNSPEIRTAQSAEFMFNGASSEMAWLVDDCKANFLKDIFTYKQPGRNMLLVTHGTCINKLTDSDGNKMINLDADGKEAYGITLLLAIDDYAKVAHVLGYLYPQDWEKIISRRQSRKG